ncbi:MAG TPA: HAD family hydrolase [Actinomycetota bacterium]|nr:HAD family hydrolase [Actinomycetota bacterium]
MTSHLDVVFLDVGGPLYSDRPYYEGLLAAIKETHPEVSDEEFWGELAACRQDQRGPFTRRLALRFVAEEEYRAVVDRGKELWSYPPDSLLPDVVPALEALSGRYRLGVLANQERWIRDVMARDGIDRFFEVWAVSAEVGADKPDPALFRHALAQAEADPQRCAMVGDRLDNDMLPARALGMRTVWVLRGEAPDDPTPEQLAGSDTAVRSLDEVPAALDGLASPSG